MVTPTFAACPRKSLSAAADWRLHICAAAEPVRLDSLDFEISFGTVFEDLG